MKKKDLLILSCLRRNARESLTNISKETYVPISTIFERMKSQYTSVLRKATVLLNFSHLGFLTVAHIVFRIHKDDRKNFRDHLLKHPHVNTLYRINNGYDYLCECIFRNIKEVEEFLERLDTQFNIEEHHAYYIIEEVKKETFLEDPQLLDHVMRQEAPDGTSAF